MRASSSTAVLAAAFLISLTAYAAPAPTESARPEGMTFGLTLVQPLPPWNDAGIGLAPWLGFTTPMWRNLLATARAGYIAHRDKTITVGSGVTESITYSSWELPVLVGVEYASPGHQGLLLSGEVGYVLRGSGATYAHEANTSSTDHGAGIAIGTGYRVSRLEARVHWIMLGLPDPAKQKAVMLGLQWLLPL